MTPVSPRASVVYCAMTREAVRLTNTSDGHSPRRTASKNAALIFQNTRGSLALAASARPRLICSMARAAASSPERTTLSNRLVNLGAHGRTIRQRLHRERNRCVDPAPLLRPQIGRVHPVTTDQVENIAVLRKQCHR
jgi:hypothetical protein